MVILISLTSFFFNDTATTEIYTLSLHDALPISVDAGTMHALWWDSRNDPCYSPQRPVGNCADGSTVPSLDAFAASGSTESLSWSAATRLSTVTSNPNWEQFSGGTGPVGGVYL